MKDTNNQPLPTAPGHLFTWLPRHSSNPSLAAGVVYTLYLYEINDDDDPNEIAITGQTPFRVIETNQPNYFYGPNEVPLQPGKRYAWQVQVADLAGNAAFENNGFSPPQAFTLLGKPCPTVLNPTHSIDPDNAVTIVWDAAEGATAYQLNLQTQDGSTETYTTPQTNYLLLQQPAPQTYQYTITTRCSSGQQSQPTTQQTYQLQTPQEESWISDPQLTYTPDDSYPVGEEESPEEVEEETDPIEELTEMLNTPISFVILPEEDGEESKILPVLPANPSLEQLEDIIKPLKPTCAGVVATYSCGVHDAVPQYTGERISVNAGDELGMNSLVLKVVEIDGSGNGIGTIKLPMLNGARLALKLSGIQVAKGGCIVAGRAEISDDVPLLQLDAKLKENLQSISMANQLVANAGQEYAGAISETINNIKEFLAKAKDFAKNYKGGKKDAAKAKAYADYAAKAQKAILDNKAIPDSVKQTLQTAIAASKPAWDFFKTGQSCEVKGTSGGGNSYFTFTVAECAAYSKLIETEMQVMELANLDIDCNCVGGPSDCNEVEQIMLRIKTANQAKEKMVTFDKNTLLVDYRNDGLSSLTGIDIGGKCFHLHIENKFSTGTILLDMDDFEIDKPNEHIKLKGKNGEIAVIIQRLPKTRGTFDDLVAYLGFGTGSDVGFSKIIDEKLLKKIFPNVDEDYSNEILTYLNQYLNQFGLNSCESRIMFFTQIAEETDNLGLLEEAPSDWASSSSNYKGRGMFQLTGKRNYKKFGAYCKSIGDEVDFVKHPDKINEPKYSVLSAFWFWNVNNCQKYASPLTENNMLKIAKITNCGSVSSNCSENDRSEPCNSCKPNGWGRRKLEFERLKNTFPCN